MTFRRLLTILLVVGAFLLVARPASAAMDCSVNTFDTSAASTRDLTTCVGGLPSEAALRSTTLKLNCLSNSNVDTTVVGRTAVPEGCRATTNDTINIGSLPNLQIQRDANGFWTCSTIKGINRAAGLVSVSYSSPGAGQCSTSEVVTRPDNWSFTNEGLPWQGQAQFKRVCEYAGAKQGECELCMGDGSHVWTAIGCIPADSGGFITKFLTLGIGIAGGIGFILILVGGFQIMTSAGNPEQLNAGRELVGSAIAGLLVTIFAVFILRVIGVDILSIPGFG